jgi:diamine N-acetyltransferase
LPEAIVTLRDLTPDNWQTCIRLKVRDDQSTFVATNVYSVAESKIEPSLMPRAIYAGDEMVGFTMYGRDPADGSCWVVRLMIDQRYQGRGYGRAAMQAVIELLRAYPDCHDIYLGVEPDNPGAQKLYASLGFAPDGMAGTEIKMRLRV